ncbi:hypothetical protein BT1A1_0384 [Caldibacillus thermoamylovorans]|jgi:hypothetical protein|uniref:Uncharacterized protein n=1 Tax=Caldibacillus thermoamylovorans TaxID=35841 RepID=A0A090IXH0_9BACI|nr:hypothetical protein [Caldibacillus thermoamylovorans]CEE00245.1 hypothetical protein BT1A1_0384 [Caldibacillus thermoamylovorans]
MKAVTYQGIKDIKVKEVEAPSIKNEMILSLKLRQRQSVVRIFI